MVLRRFFPALLTVWAIGAPVLASAGCGTQAPNEDSPESVGGSLEEARALDGFTAYWLGEQFMGYPARVQIRMDRAQQDRGTMIDYARCSPACEGAGGVHTTDDPRARQLGSNIHLLKRRGVPAAIDPNGTYGVLLTGRYTLMIGAKDRAALERAFDLVRPIDGEIEPHLPAPSGHVPEKR